MAELIDAIQAISDNVINNRGLTDLVIGTVTAIEPLKVKLDATMIDLEAAQLFATQMVTKKTITITGHTHDINVLGHAHSYIDSVGENATPSTKTTETALDGTYTSIINYETMFCTDGPEVLPVEGNVITINRGLVAGDKLLMLRVFNGNNFLIISRIYPAAGG